MRIFNDTPWTLSQVLLSVREIISEVFPETLWIIAEIADIRKDTQKGHVYLELVEKKDGLTLAKAKGNIWNATARGLLARFRSATGEEPRAGMNILFAAQLVFREVYGFSLTIQDIDPLYTLGEMARKKREVLERLEREDLLDRNRSLSIPPLIKVIAVISSPEAAGYDDFCRHLADNSYGYHFLYHLFPARMQGREAEQSIIGALRRIERVGRYFDLAVIIRGGGSVTDLNCFDGYNLANAVARFPLPVLSGIGHQRDETVLDRVAHTRLKTPTAVADFLIGRTREFEERLLQAQETLRRGAERVLVNERYRLSLEGKHFLSTALALLGELWHCLSLNDWKLPVVVDSILRHGQEGIETLWSRFGLDLCHRFRREWETLTQQEQVIALLDPVNVLKRGYSITLCRDGTVREARMVQPGDVLTTKFWKGTAVSRVEETHE